MSNKKIPEYRTEKQLKKLRNEAYKQDVPFFAINKGFKFGKINFDTHTSNYSLKKGPVEKIRKLFKILDATKRPDYIQKEPWYVLDTYGISPKVKLDICKKYAPNVAEILFNKGNCHKLTVEEIISASRKKQ